MHMTNASIRTGSALILIMAILTFTVVLAFGTLAFVSDQRAWARNKQLDGVIRQTLLSGRAHAQRVIEKAYADARTAGNPTLPSQAWTTAFAPTSAWPSVATQSNEALRQSARQAQATAAWGGANAVDLWRFETGIASPIVRSSSSTPHGHDDGWSSHDGTGRWFTIAWLDRDLRPVDQAKASYQLRYAVAAIDLGGLLLGNKARYEHVTSGSRLGATYRTAATDESAAATAAPATTDRYAATATRDDVPTSGSPCPQTDLPIGQNNDSVGSNLLRYNTWRPIPADHTFTANMLLTVGCGLDDSTPRSFGDSAVYQGTANVGTNTYAYFRRTGGNLPDSWRAQGYQTVTLAYWQYSRRFGDFLPFDQNPHPVTAADANGNAVKTNYAAGNVSDTFLDASKTPPVANRHPAALLSAMHAFQASTSEIGPYASNPKNTYPYSGDPYSNPLAANARRAGDMWNQVDLSNWLAQSQALRLHRIYSGNNSVNGLPSRPTGADGMTQCWSPFGGSIGRFADRAGSALRRKNDWEMRYQWTPDANTAPAQVLLDVLRLAVPEDASGHSAESVSATDRDAYLASLNTIAATIASRRPFASGSALAADVPTWSGDPAIGRMLQSCVFGGDGSALTPTDLGLGAGPRAEFEVREWDTSATPFVVVRGRHVRRFWTGLAITDRADAIYRLRGWTVGNAASTPDLWVQTNIAAPKYGAEYVSGSPGSWALNASGDHTRIYLASTSGIATGATRVIVHYPGVSLTVALSRWFRVSIRAELHDLDVPEASRDQSMDMVLHLDPDNSGPAAGTGMWDSDVPYCDLENSLQWRTTGGSLIW